MLKLSILTLTILLALSTPVVFSDSNQAQKLEARKKILDTETRQLREQATREQERLNELQEKLKIWLKKNEELDEIIRAEKAQINPQNIDR